jgi:hypothetical protein
MNIGMLWFDNDPNMVMTAKIARAAKYYQNKYGDAPSLCFVHPSMLPLVDDKKNGLSGNGKSAPKSDAPLEVVKAGNVEIRSNRSILPNHFWIGINGKLNGNGSGSSAR